MELLHNTGIASPGTWICECDVCWEQLLSEDCANLRLALKCSRGRAVFTMDDMRFIVASETIDDFAELVGLGTIREIFIAPHDAPTGRIARNPQLVA